MTNKAREQILQTWRAIEKLRKIIDSKMDEYVGANSQEFADLLEQYQSAVVMVGTSIENTESEELRGNIITCLEQYCEDIYLLSQSADSKDDYRKVVIRLRESHRDIDDKISKLPTKKMALFLPYKFSMWDSLESIYIAANDDPDFDAVLMPIPYMECEEGKEPVWIYEGPQYYTGFDAKRYDSFDISEQKPDVIYIHNPYDQYNRVTSVAPDYYSNVLKEHCEKLVYVPYFFTNSEFPGVHRDLYSYKNHDYIIVPSEKARQQVAEFNPGDKVQALGSPKIDRMLALENNFVIPEEWKNRIRGRKVVLYNVSLSSILQNGFQVILKMNYIFNYFKTHQDVVLWWRPHPLLKSSLKTMRPELYGAYEAMERIFILDKIGIYDVTPDSNRAIAATDAFLGDYSSMCGLYGIVGKPIFLTETLSLEEPSDEDRRKFNIMYPACDSVGSVRVDNSVVFFSADYRSLCLMDLDSYKVTVLKKFEEEYFRVNAYNVSEPDKTELYLFPVNRDNPVKIYSMKTGEIRVASEFENLPLQKYGMVWDRGDSWLVAPREETEALIINKETGDIVKTNNLNDKLYEYSMLTGDPLLSGASVVFDNKLYTLAFHTEKMLITDLDTNKSELVDIGDKGYYYNAFSFINNEFWLYEWNGKAICKWSPVTKEAVYYTDFPEDYLAMCSSLVTPYTPSILGAVYYEEHLIVLPFMGNMILKINVNTGAITRCVLELPYEEGQRRSSFYTDRNNYISLLLYDEKNLLLQTAFDKGIVKYDMENETTSYASALFPEKEYEESRVSVKDKAVRDRNQSPYIIYEKGTNCSLNDMMQYLITLEGWDKKRQHDASCEGIENADGTCGQKIHEFIKNKL